MSYCKLKNGKIKYIWSDNIEEETMNLFPAELSFTYDIEFDLPEIYQYGDIEHLRCDSFGDKVEEQKMKLQFIKQEIITLVPAEKVDLRQGRCFGCCFEHDNNIAPCNLCTNDTIFEKTIHFLFKA